MSMTEITIQSRVNKETKVPEREITLPAPKVLQASKLADLVAMLGEEMVFNDAMNQLIIKFRAKIRTMLESETDGTYTYDDAAIKAMDFSDWTPETRVRMTEEEKILQKLGGLDPAALKAILAKVKQQVKA